ncbi:MAG: ABC transporter ATP-binding protein [Steroidobacteraceae bacterium]
MAAIRIRDLCKSYGDAKVLRSINLDIDDGEFVVLVGPSGCGKSTLLRLIAGLEAITSGEIRIGERVINELAPKDRDVAMVFQSYALYPHMTVRENMSFSLKLKGLSRDRIAAAVDAAAAKLEIRELLDRKPRVLSGGQRQRVAMGRAMVREPKAFLFDEPLSNLDARLREQMRFEIRKLQRDLGTTSIYVTHDQIEAMTMADRIVAMHAGIAQQIGTPADLYDNPANLFVAGFIGSPAMNLIKGKVRINGKANFVSEAGIAWPLKSAPSGADGRACIYGVRPEHLSLGLDGGVNAEVTVIEPTGSETHLIAKIGDQKIVGVFRERVGAKPGEMLRLTPNVEAVHLFDAETGKRLD